MVLSTFNFWGFCGPNWKTLDFNDLFWKNTLINGFEYFQFLEFLWPIGGGGGGGGLWPIGGGGGLWPVSVVAKLSIYFKWVFFSRRFPNEKCPTITVSSFFFFFSSDYNLSDWATFLTIETTKTTTIRQSPVSGN